MAYTEADTSKFVQAGKVRMHYNEAGEGEPLMLIHGGGPGATGPITAATWMNWLKTSAV
jgi:2-hydroxy-6-oxonona-2,4-dienedioate hydrolase